MEGNINFVGVQGDDVIFMKPPKMRMNKQEALEFSAWIVCLAGDYELKEFKKVFEEVCNS